MVNVVNMMAASSKGFSDCLRAVRLLLSRKNYATLIRHECKGAEGRYSQLIPVINGVKQGSVLALTLFSVVFSVMPMDTSEMEASM